MKNILSSTLVGSVLALSLVATGCSSDNDCGEFLCNENGGGGPGGNGGNGNGNGVGPGGNTTPPGQTCSDAAQERIGLGGTSLKAGREEGIAAADRKRSKSFDVLSGELGRVLGNTPPSMAGLGATFGESPARWINEAKPSSVAMGSALDVSFEGCLKYTETDAAYATAPDVSTATAACTLMARKFWSRVVDPADIQGCIDVATVDSANETYASGTNGDPITKPTAPRRRWAYACASLLTSTQFMTY